MNSAIIPREQAYAAARPLFDAALNRIARDLAAGRLSPDAEQRIRAAIARRAARTTAHRAAA